MSVCIYGCLPVCTSWLADRGITSCLERTYFNFKLVKVRQSWTQTTQCPHTILTSNQIKPNLSQQIKMTKPNDTTGRLYNFVQMSWTTNGSHSLISPCYIGNIWFETILRQQTRCFTKIDGKLSWLSIYMDSCQSIQKTTTMCGTTRPIS